MIFFRLNQFIFLFLSPESIILVVQIIKAQFSNHSYKFIVLGFLDLSSFITWARDPICGLTIIIQNKTHVNRKFQKINSKREKKTFLQIKLLETVRKLLASVVVSNEKERQFWAIFWWYKGRSSATMLGSDYQGMELKERRWSHGGTGGAERNGERKRWKFFDFAKRGKAREDESLKKFLVVMLGSGCGALELRER